MIRFILRSWIYSSSQFKTLNNLAKSYKVLSTFFFSADYTQIFKFDKIFLQLFLKKNCKWWQKSTIVLKDRKTDNVKIINGNDLDHCLAIVKNGLFKT